MSYARFGWNDSDVYVFVSVTGHLECCGCHLTDPGVPFIASDTEAMIRHLNDHRMGGDHVPTETYKELRTDQAENDAWIASKREAPAT